MSKTVVKTGRRTQGEAPAAYYYLGRYIDDSRRIEAQHFKDRWEMKRRLDRLIVQYFGSLEEDGWLQEDLNLYHHGILNDLKKDFPHFSRKRILVFAYTAARIPRGTIAEWTGTTKGAISCLRSHLRTEISCHCCPRQQEYLDLLRGQ